MNKEDQAKRCMDDQRWQDAIPILVADIAENEDDPWSPMYLGSCYYELHHYAEAMRWFRHAERIDPDCPIPVGLQGDVEHAIGNTAEARQLYQRALRIDPQDELAIKNWKRFISIEGDKEQAL